MKKKAPKGKAKGKVPSMEALYRRLGEFVIKQNPYRATVRLPGNLNTYKSVEKFGPGKYYDADNPLPVDYLSAQRGGAYMEKVLDALFFHLGEPEGKVRRVSKAVRIPYRYRDRDGTERIESMIIGYEGMGGPG
jgi:hypothetical protein